MFTLCVKITDSLWKIGRMKSLHYVYDCWWNEKGSKIRHFIKIQNSCWNWNQGCSRITSIILSVFFFFYWVLIIPPCKLLHLCVKIVLCIDCLCVFAIIAKLLVYIYMSFILQINKLIYFACTVFMQSVNCVWLPRHPAQVFWIKAFER